MATLVLTVIGDDRSGLVSALSGVIADHGGSWERSQMARLAGKFAGIVLVAVPDDRAEALIAELGPLGTQGLLDVTVERGADEGPVSTDMTRLSLALVGGMLFEATATLLAPPTVPIADLQAVLEDLANELMVDLSLSAD
jgi:glycine cleavage system regulatory protein